LSILPRDGEALDYRSSDVANDNAPRQGDREVAPGEETFNRRWVTRVGDGVPSLGRAR
jgi:hypothetical protein